MGINEKKNRRKEVPMEKQKSEGTIPRPPTLHKDPASYKGKTLTILNRCAENPEAFVNK